MRITIRSDTDYTQGKDPLGRLGEIVIESHLFQLGNLDSGISDAELLISGERYLVTDFDVTRRGDDEASVVIEVAPASANPRDSVQAQEQPEW